MSRHLAVILLVMCVTPAKVNAQTEPMHMSVATASASVHKSPSTGSPVIGTARRGAALEVTRELGDWVRVSWPDSPDGFGYVHRSMGRLVRGTAPAPKTVVQVPTRPGTQPVLAGAKRSAAADAAAHDAGDAFHLCRSAHALLRRRRPDDRLHVRLGRDRARMVAQLARRAG